MFSLLDNLELSPLAIIVLGLLVIFIGIFAVRFDLNRWLELRYERQKLRYRSLCPHVDLHIQSDNTVEVRSLYVSPSGTTAWQCQRCGAVTHGQETIEIEMQYWANNSLAYVQRMKRQNRVGRRL